MGQSSAKSGAATGGAETKDKRANAVTVLRCEEYLGRCWLLASSKESFSPSRWVPLTARTLAGSRGAEKRAFSVSTKVLRGAKRDKISFLTRYNISVTEGLDVTPFDAISVASYTREELKGRCSLLQGGQQIEVASGLSLSFPVCLVISIKRVEVEMQVPQYESRNYKRFPLQAPAPTEEGRQEVGEGCITGVAFGGYLVVGCAQNCAEDVCKRLDKALNGVPVKEENKKSSIRAPKVDLSQACTADNFRVLSCGFKDSALQPYTTASFRSVPLEKALEGVVQYVQCVYTDPRRWVITNLFMQRYEALGAFILSAN